jgi:hypothetical protein
VDKGRDRTDWEVSRVLHETSPLGLATQALIAAALHWSERDYGEDGELEAEAALSDAVRHFKLVAAPHSIDDAS